MLVSGRVRMIYHLISCNIKTSPNSVITPPKTHSLNLRITSLWKGKSSSKAPFWIIFQPFYFQGRNVDGRNPSNQLRLVVFPFIPLFFKVLAPSPVVISVSGRVFLTRQIHNEKVSCLMIEVGSFVATSRGASQVDPRFFWWHRGVVFTTLKLRSGCFAEFSLRFFL